MSGLNWCELIAQAEFSDALNVSADLIFERFVNVFKSAIDLIIPNKSCKVGPNNNNGNNNKLRKKSGRKQTNSNWYIPEQASMKNRLMLYYFFKVFGIKKVKVV